MFNTKEYILFTFLSAYIVLSQTYNYRFINYGLNEGLSQLTINTIYQDSEGFIWVGTQDGLNRFDGLNFSTFKRINSDSTSISSNHIMKIIEDQNKEIWIATRDGLNKFNRKTKTFKRFGSEVLPNTVLSDIYISKDGNFWLGSEKGLIIFNPKTKSTRQFSHNKFNPRSISNDNVKHIFVDSKQRMWIATYGGLNFFNYNDSTFFSYQMDEKDSKSLTSNLISHISESHDGYLWISTTAGLNRFNPITQKVNSYFTPKSKMAISNQIIRFSFEDEKKNIVFGTHGAGLFIFDRDKNSLISFKNEYQKSNSISSNSVVAYLIDNLGDLWLGTMNGLSKTDKNSSNFQSITTTPSDPIHLVRPEVYSIYVDKKYIMAGNIQGGLNIYNKQTQKLINLSSTSTPITLNNNTIFKIVKVNDDEFWIGTYFGGINKVNFKTKKVEILSNKSVPYALGSNLVVEIFDDGDGYWIGLFNYGVDYINKSTNQITHFVPDENNPNSLSNSRIRFINKDKKGRIFIGTDGGGINVFDKTTSSFTVYNTESKVALSNNEVMSGLILDDNRIMIGTYDGINILDIDNNKIEIYSEKEGLPNNVVYGVLKDDLGFYWISTNNGISRFNLNKKEFKNYNQYDGLISREYNSGAYFKDQKGLLYFGSSKGIDFFDPKKIKDNTNIPPIKITNVNVFNKTYNYSTEDLELNHDQNVVSFSFVALNYIHPEKNQYAYQMVGFDKDWVYSQNRNFVTYTNLDPGSYIFKVKGSNNDGVWNEKGISLNVHILPPFYQNPFFLVALLSISIMLLILWYVNLQKQKKKLEDLVKVRTNKLQQKSDELEKINEFIRTLNMDIDIDRLIETVLKESYIIEGVETATLISLDKEFNKYRVKQTLGQNIKDITNITMTLQEASQRYIEHTDEIEKDIYIINNISGRILEDKIKKIPKSMIVLKIVISDLIEGFLVLENFSKVNAFEKSDIHLLQNLKGHIVAAYHKASLLQELKNLNEKKNIFLGFAAHDLRNPLTNIIGYVSLLIEYIKNDFSDKEKLIKDLNHVLKMSDTMSMILTDLLDISAIESGKVNLTLGKIHFKTILDENIEYYQRLARQKDITLDINMSNINELPDIMVDKSKILEVVDNLLSNALKYTFPGGKISVDGKRKGDDIIIEITDNGQGLSKEDLKEIFTSFKRLSAKPTGGESSTGLGLMIVKKLVEMHGGNIWVESKKGVGSTFTFSLNKAS